MKKSILKIVAISVLNLMSLQAFAGGTVGSASNNQFFRFGIDHGKGTVDGYSIKDCTLVVPEMDQKTKAYLEETLSKKGYRPFYTNALFMRGMSLLGMESIQENPYTHRNSQLSGRAFLVISEDREEIKTTMKVYGEDGFELGVSFQGQGLNYMPRISVDGLPDCKQN